MRTTADQANILISIFFLQVHFIVFIIRHDTMQTDFVFLQMSTIFRFIFMTSTWPASKLQLRSSPYEIWKTPWHPRTTQHEDNLHKDSRPLSRIMHTVTGSFEGQLHATCVRARYKVHRGNSPVAQCHSLVTLHDCLRPLTSTPVCTSWLTLKMSKKEVYIDDVEEYFQDTGPTLTFQNLYYCVHDRRFCCKRGPAKYILKDVR